MGFAIFFILLVYGVLLMMGVPLQWTQEAVDHRTKYASPSITSLSVTDASVTREPEQSGGDETIDNEAIDDERD